MGLLLSLNARLSSFPPCSLSQLLSSPSSLPAALPFFLSSSRSQTRSSRSDIFLLLKRDEGSYSPLSPVSPNLLATQLRSPSAWHPFIFEVQICIYSHVNKLQKKEGKAAVAEGPALSCHILLPGQSDQTTIIWSLFVKYLENTTF